MSAHYFNPQEMINKTIIFDERPAASVASSFHVAYGIDKNADSIYTDIDVVSKDENLEEVDAVVVTAITFFDEIEEELSARLECPILSLEDILYEV